MFEEYKVSQEILSQRLNLCNSCENNLAGICKKCGCVIKLKTNWKITKCPIGKWDSVDTDVNPNDS